MTGKILATDLRTKIAQQGYTLVHEHRPKASIVNIAEEFGTPLIPWEGGLVQTLVPRAGAAPNTYSGNFGFGHFPFHTDLAHWRRPPRYLLLRCLVGYQDVPTLIVDGHSLIDAISRDILARAIFKPRRPHDGALALLRLFEPAVGDADLLRWDEIYLRPASRVGEIANVQIRDWLTNAAPLSIRLFRPGDTLIVDNWRMLHARSPIPPGREDRSIQRVYLGGLH